MYLSHHILAGGVTVQGCCRVQCSSVVDSSHVSRNVNSVNVHVYSPDNPLEFSRLYSYTPGIGRIISSGENSAHFLLI